MQMTLHRPLRKTEQISNGLVATAFTQKLDHLLFGPTNGWPLLSRIKGTAALVTFPQFMGQQLQRMMALAEVPWPVAQGHRGQYRQASMGRTDLVLKKMPKLDGIVQGLMLR